MPFDGAITKDQKKTDIGRGQSPIIIKGAQK